MKKVFWTVLLMIVSAPFFSVSPVVGEEPAAPIELFKSANLDDWDFFLDDAALKKTDVWEFRDGGILYCKGMPYGWLATKDLYKNFRFTVEYRWPEGVEPSNSGIFLRITGEPRTLPCCVECQLKSGKAGDLYGFEGRRIKGSPERSKRTPMEGKGDLYAVTQFAQNENPAHEWNRLEIVCQEGTILVVLNGKIVNWTLDAAETEGKLGLQSEGGPIEFQNAVLTPLP